MKLLILKLLLVFFLFFLNENLWGQITPIYNTIDNYRLQDTLRFTMRPLYQSNYLEFISINKKKSWLRRKLTDEPLLQVKKDDFYLRGNFILDLSVGKESQGAPLLYNNTRGVSIEGKINDFSFYSNIYENQFKVPLYLNNYILDKKVYPGLGYNFNNSPQLFDFSYTTASVSYKLKKYFNFQLANDKLFIGNGYRSLLLSDVSVPYPFFRITTQLGKFQYTNIYAQNLDIYQPRISSEIGFRKKFVVSHYLEFASKRWRVGLFESVVYQNSDSLNKRGFELGYLNPIIFIRPQEYVFGSSDNVLVGLNIAFDITKNTQIYGQLIVDEFKLSEILKNRGWWANKQGFQLGIKTKKLFGYDNLAGFTELNVVPPYTYSSRNSVLSYSNYNEPLAHPIGANFYEWVSKIEWIYKKWYFYYQINIAKYGINGAGFINVGQNILQSYNTRDKEYNNYIGQGVPVTLLFSNLQFGYTINRSYNLRIEGQYIYRNEVVNSKDNITNIFYIGFKTGFRNIYLDK